MSADAVAALFGHGAGLWCSRGATGLYLAARAVLPKGASILVPAITCPAAVFPLIAAGMKVVGCDVDGGDFNIGIPEIEETLADHPEISAVLAIHSFGHLLAIEEIVSLAKSRSLLVIEDVCQALGAEKAGSHGDIAVFSFGATKQYDLGGGALVACSDRGRIRAMSDIQETLPFVTDPIQMQARYREAYFAAGDFDRSHLAADFSALFVHRDRGQLPRPHPEDLVSYLARDSAHRRLISSIYAGLDAPDRLAKPAFRPGSNPWRYTFSVKRGDARDLGDWLRSHGFNASHWYPSLHDGFIPVLRATPVADMLGANFLNLWVDGTVSPKQAGEQVRLIEEYLETESNLI